jgi:purine-binding chemotaxis protein CheW
MSDIETLHVVFEVGGAAYVLPASVVLELESFTEVTPVPGTPRHVAGIVQIRGQVVPLVDLRVRFGLPPAAPSLDRRVLVVQHDGRRIGMLTDVAREVVKISPTAFEDPPELVAEHAGGFVKAVARLGPRLVMLLDHERTLGQELDDDRATR